MTGSIISRMQNALHLLSTNSAQLSCQYLGKRIKTYATGRVFLGLHILQRNCTTASLQNSCFHAQMKFRLFGSSDYKSHVHFEHSNQNSCFLMPKANVIFTIKFFFEAKSNKIVKKGNCSFLLFQQNFQLRGDGLMDSVVACCGPGSIPAVGYSDGFSLVCSQT